MDTNAKATILVIDASSERLARFEDMLGERHQVRRAHDAEEALRIVAGVSGPDLILFDAALPDSASLLVRLSRARAGADLPAIALADDDAGADAQRALRAGAADVLALAVSPELLRRRIELHLSLKHANALLKDRHRHFEHLVAERTREVALLQDATVMAMATLAESRDPQVGAHLRRTQHYVTALARQLRFNARHTAELTDQNIAWLYKAAPLHDIGKAGVPDTILDKPGKLTADEFAIMQRHTVYGRDAIANVERTLGHAHAFTRYASEIAYSHHEKWDGSGYPQGLVGSAIPLAARLMAVADVYDALISARSYRPAFTHETAIELIRHGSGEHFDPEVVDVALKIEEELRAIAVRFGAPVD